MSVLDREREAEAKQVPATDSNERPDFKDAEVIKDFGAICW